MSLLPRLLRGLTDRGQRDLRSHVEVAGPLPELQRWAPERLIDEIERSGLRGRGGASFPVATKMRAVSSRRGPRVVLANGAEGEPASGKDRLLLTELPHLILDGAAVAARAVDGAEVIVTFARDDSISESLRSALDERRRARIDDDPRFKLVDIDGGFVSGHESALVNFLSGAEAKPSFDPRPFEHGVRRRPTLVQNVETLAHLGLIVRHGAGWYREAGTARDPGSTLITLSGAVAGPGVYEIEHGAPLQELLDAAGLIDDLAAVLIGGYFGSWFRAPAIPRLLLSPGDLAEHGASLGAGVIVALGRSVCPVAETARVADYFALESAGQCGPCVNGLGAIADTIQRIASGTATATAGRDLARWSSSIAGRGACQFPDGATRFVSSALRVFAGAFDDHLRHGPCAGCKGPPVLPVPFSMPYLSVAASPT
jgi:NADH:ubiquinone oxidoreductase subunit F (NADH-binding)